LNRPIECVLCLINGRSEDLMKFGGKIEHYPFSLRAIAELIQKPRTEAFSESFKIISEIIGKEDPYYEQKEELNKLAAKLLSEIELNPQTEKDLLRLGAAANAFDTSVFGYKFETYSLSPNILFDAPAIDEAGLINWEEVETITYVPDNSGEAVIDAYIIRKMRSMGYKVKAILREEPYEIDATYKDFLKFGFGEEELIPTRGNNSPLYKKRIGWRAEEALLRSDIIISKGIANLEGYVDAGRWLAGKVIFLLRAKCPVIAKAFGVPRKSPIIVTEETAWKILNSFLKSN